MGRANNGSSRTRKGGRCLPFAQRNGLSKQPALPPGEGGELHERPRGQAACGPAQMLASACRFPFFSNVSCADSFKWLRTCSLVEKRRMQARLSGLTRGLPPASRGDSFFVIHGNHPRRPVFSAVEGYGEGKQRFIPHPQKRALPPAAQRDGLSKQPALPPGSRESETETPFTANPAPARPA